MLAAAELRNPPIQAKAIKTYIAGLESASLILVWTQPSSGPQAPACSPRLQEVHGEQPISTQARYHAYGPQSRSIPIPSSNTLDDLNFYAACALAFSGLLRVGEFMYSE